MPPILFLNISWMSKYQGLANDTISGGFEYVTRHGYGHEIFNFKPYDGQMYGFARAPHDSIRLENLGASKDASSFRGVLVVWVAKSRIVGWYKNATVFRSVQSPPPASRRIFRSDEIGYNVTALERDCRLLDPDARLFLVPRAKERAHAMGRYLWYAEGDANRAFRDRVGKYIATGGKTMASKKNHGNGGFSRQPDPLMRKRIEEAAVVMTTQHFKNLGYEVDSVEKDNVGWDLIALHSESGACLRLEVKGLSGNGVFTEMTPNEYEMMRKYKDSYRICIANNCLATGSLSIFSYNQAAGAWVDENDRPLLIEERKSARLRA